MKDWTVSLRGELTVWIVAQFDNVPATCLNLATALTGGCGVEGPFPVICGSACVKWEGLTQDQFIELSGYLTDGEA